MECHTACFCADSSAPSSSVLFPLVGTFEVLCFFPTHACALAPRAPACACMRARGVCTCVSGVNICSQRLCARAHVPNLCVCASACGRVLIPIVAGSQGCYFIDRSPDYFSYVLKYLRRDEILLPKDQRQLRQIWNEADFYGLDGLKHLLREHGLLPENLYGICAEERQLIDAIQLVLCRISEEPSARGLLRVGGWVSATITARFMKVGGEGLERGPRCCMTDIIELGFKTSMASQARYLSSSKVH